MLEELKQKVFKANLELPKNDLVKLTWGNVSGIDRKSNLIVIKPSGVPYEEMSAEDMVVVDLDGNVVEGRLRPSSDTPTHIVLYKTYSELGGIVHTHSTWATIWAQACMPVPELGTTHADSFYGEIPCTRKLTKNEVEGEYEKETGNVIVSTFKEKNLDVSSMPGVIISCHGPFTWGKDPFDAVHNAIILEQVCNMAYHTVLLNKDVKPVDQYLADKHYLRKHGKNAYYGQEK